MLTKKMDYITAAAMWQGSNISKKHKEFLYCIDKLGQNHVIPQCGYFLSEGKIIHF